MSIKTGGTLGILLALFVTSGAQAQTIDLSLMNTDVNTVFTSIGRDISPRLHQIALSGNELVGEARLHGITRFYVALGSSVTTIDGVAKILQSDNEDDWAYKTLPISKIVKNALTEGSSAEDAFNTVTGKAFPMPSARIGFGFPLPFGMEFLGNTFYLPASLFDTALGMAGNSVDFDKLDPRAEIFTIGGIIRKNILSDTKSFWRPSVSLGIGYTYSHFLMAFDKFSLDALNMEPPDVAGLGVLDMSGSMDFKTNVHSFGVVLGVSKTFLLVFVPYVRAAAYYHIATYNSSFQVTANILETNADGTINEAKRDTPVDTVELDAPVSIRTDDISFIVSSGLELRLLPITLLVGASLDLERPVTEINDFSMTGFKMNGFAVTASLRMQI
jgi:hypothetical protein